MKKEHNFYAIAMAILGSELRITPPPGHRLVKVWQPLTGFTYNFEPIDANQKEDARLLSASDAASDTEVS